MKLQHIPPAPYCPEKHTPLLAMHDDTLPHAHHVLPYLQHHTRKPAAYLPFNLIVDGTIEKTDISCGLFRPTQKDINTMTTTTVEKNALDHYETIIDDYDQALLIALDAKRYTDLGKGWGLYHGEGGEMVILSHMTYEHVRLPSDAAQTLLGIIANRKGA